eukprot:3015447-Prymnesium_polylepis.1
MNAQDGELLLGWLEPPIYCHAPSRLVDRGGGCTLEEERAGVVETTVIMLIVGLGVVLLVLRLSSLVALTWAGDEGRMRHVPYDTLAGRRNKEQDGQKH